MFQFVTYLPILQSCNRCNGLVEEALGLEVVASGCPWHRTASYWFLAPFIGWIAGPAIE